MQNTVVHAAERQMFQLAIDRLLARARTRDAADAADALITLMEKVLGSSWSPESYAMLRGIAENPNDKWARFADRIIRSTDRKVLSSFLLNVAYEGGFRGFKTSEEMAEKYGCNIPWIVLMDPTSACNMRCTGCWAAEYGRRQNLSFETMDRVLTEGKELGIHVCLLTGGEPLMRKDDVIRLCEKHDDIAFHAFTNGTLIDDRLCEEMLRVANFFVSISIEGFAEANDSRRGKGHFAAAMRAMERMREHRLPFGVSVCYTSRNYRDVTSDEFLDLIIEKGAAFAWYFHYMPVGMNADTSLLLTPEQRLYIKDRIRGIRALEGGKEIFAIDFQNDGEFVEGCVAGGKRYFHINAAGDVEPCVFIHYSGANINEKPLIECLRQPLFLAYRKGQPFNENHLRPCPMLENPEILQKLVRGTGAHSTDLEAPESAEHLCGKCAAYADRWQPVADRAWQETHPSQA